MSTAPNPGIFVNEDISKPENGLNLVRLGLMKDPDFREWCVQRLHLSEDSVFYPPQNVMGNLRPGYLVTSPTNEKAHRKDFVLETHLCSIVNSLPCWQSQLQAG